MIEQSFVWVLDFEEIEDLFLSLRVKTVDFTILIVSSLLIIGFCLFEL